MLQRTLGFALVLACFVAGCSPSTVTVDDGGASDASAQPDAMTLDVGHDASAPPPVDASASADAFVVDAWIDCTMEPTGAPCGDAGMGTCAPGYDCEHDVCLPTTRTCGPLPAYPCGGALLSVHWNDGSGFHTLPGADCHCLTPTEARCLYATGGGWGA